MDAMDVFIKIIILNGSFLISFEWEWTLLVYIVVPSEKTESFHTLEKVKYAGGKLTAQGKFSVNHKSTYNNQPQEDPTHVAQNT